MNEVFVTGMGAFTGCGPGVADLWLACLTSKNLVVPVPSSWSRYYASRSRSWIPLPRFDWTALGHTKTEQLTQPMSALLSLAATREALNQANWHAHESDDPYRRGVFVGTGLGDARAPFDNYRAHLLGNVARNLTTESPPEAFRAILEDLSQHPRVNPLVICQTMPNAAAAALSLEWGSRGICDTGSHACASGTVAIGRAYRAVASGHLDAALAVGVDYLGDAAGSVFMGFDRLSTLALPRECPDSENRPFDTDRTGFMFSEGGAGALLLESAQSMKRRGSGAVAKILGFAETCDAKSMVAISPETGAQSAMYRDLLYQANLAAQDIHYINAHGTGTKLNDEVESHLIVECFGRKVAVNSTKSITGHGIGVSGALEAIVTVKSVQEQLVHGSRNLDNPIEGPYLIQETTPCRIRHALSQSFGFGGHNAALLFGPAD